MIQINNYFENQHSNAKQRFKGYLSMEKLLGHIMQVAINFYYASIGINKINNGIKNSKRFGFFFQLAFIHYF